MTNAVATSTSPKQTVPQSVPVVILGTDAVLAALPATAVQLAHACIEAGFVNVIPASWGDELIAAATLRRLPEFGDGPVIHCSCPIVAHRLLSVSGDLRPVLLPLVPPPVALARYVRALSHPNRARVTYVGGVSRRDRRVDRHSHDAGRIARDARGAWHRYRRTTARLRVIHSRGPATISLATRWAADVGRAVVRSRIAVARRSRRRGSRRRDCAARARRPQRVDRRGGETRVRVQWCNGPRSHQGRSRISRVVGAASRNGARREREHTNRARSARSSGATNADGHHGCPFDARYRMTRRRRAFHRHAASRRFLSRRQSPRSSSPGIRAVVGSSPVARPADGREGKTLPRAYVARRRLSPKSTPVVPAEPLSEQAFRGGAGARAGGVDRADVQRGVDRIRGAGDHVSHTGVPVTDAEETGRLRASTRHIRPSRLPDWNRRLRTRRYAPNRESVADSSETDDQLDVAIPLSHWTEPAVSQLKNAEVSSAHWSTGNGDGSASRRSG